MAEVLQNVDLTTYNTFRIKVKCRYFAEIRNVDDFLALLQDPVYLSNKRLVLGGGSNVLFTEDFDGLVIRNNIKGIEIIEESAEFLVLKAGAGEVWHDLVMFTVQKGLGGLENLSLIPGCVGASPMQNIGAYGVEIKEVFSQLEAVDMSSGERRTFNSEECEFGYRESVFKRKYRGRYLITSVSFRLSKQPTINTSYGAIDEELKAMSVAQPNIKDVSQAVINIRRSKLPDPEVTGNAGSFFKNPEVDDKVFERLHMEYPQMVAYPRPGGGHKLAAGWLIEQCGMKGFVHKGAAVHNRQALVLVNQHNARGQDVLELSDIIIDRVREKFGVQLEREVNIIG